MAKITKIETTSFTKDGKTSISYKATLADGNVGFFNPKTPDEFKENDDVSYTAVDKTGKKGAYKVFTFTKSEPQHQNAPEQPQKSPTIIPSSQRPSEWGAKSIADMKFEARLDVIELVTRLLLAGKIELKEAKEYFTEWVVMVDTSIDEIEL